ncbi:MAG TPA: replication-relaxation family protein [Solirubrobacteraceae bacterium]|nr:replication-relaxation family protein [Solirubrobacteraceae bacterium]
MLYLPRLTRRDLSILSRLSHHEPLSTSEIALLFFDGQRACRRRLLKLQKDILLIRIYPAREQHGGRTEGLWFLSPHGRRVIGAPARRPPALSIPDLEHRRAVAQFFLALVERSLAQPDHGLYSWLGEQHAQHGTSTAVRPDGFGRYLLPDGEITFYLELDRGTEPTRRIKDKLAAYHQALAADPQRSQGNILLICQSQRRLANLARTAPTGPPWVWGSIDGERYVLLPDRDQQRNFQQLPAWRRDLSRRLEDCLGRRWKQPTKAEKEPGR